MLETATQNTAGPQRVLGTADLLKVLEQATHGMSIRFKFRTDAVRCMRTFAGLMNKRGMDFVKPADQVNLMAVTQSGEWGSALNRTYLVRPNFNFPDHLDQIAEQLGPLLESIELLPA